MSAGGVLDDDGYPTEDGLVALDQFDGAPEALVAYIGTMMEHYGFANVEDFIDDFGNVPSKRLTLVTGGWSGCEEVIGRLSNTLFHFAFWESSWRGGKHTYVIPAKLWGHEGWWGKP
jgi:hypothetical protein